MKLFVSLLFDTVTTVGAMSNRIGWISIQINHLSSKKVRAKCRIRPPSLRGFCMNKMFKFKSNLGWAGIVLLSLAPVFMWAVMKPVGERFSDLETALASLGQMSGLAGMAMFASVLSLSGRFKFLEDYFGGLNRIYINHHFFAGLAFILMMSHPLFLAGRFFIFSPRMAALLFIPGSNWPINFGIFALSLLIVLLFITFFVRQKIPYEKWKFTHKFLGLAFFLTGLHGFLISSDISRFLPLRIYMFFLAVIGLAIYFYRAVFGFWLVKRSSYIVHDVKLLGEKVVEIEMSPQGNPIIFIPGQFIFISFKSSDIKPQTHPFSITSSPFDRNLKIAPKAVGDFTASLRNLKIGSAAKIEGPFGRFFSRNSKDQVWVAGGIGITPFMSMARALRQDKENTGHIDLFYSALNENESVFLKELSQISSMLDNFKIFPFFSSTQGRITADYIRNTIGNLDGKEIFLCGPPTMMRNIKSQFLKIDVAKSDIHSEEFQL